MSNVKSYDLSVTPVNLKLEKNFSLSELRCRCGCKTALIDLDLLQILQQTREYFDLPVIIGSFYRCSAYNRRIGGAINSNHMKGRAADLDIGSGIDAIDPLIGAIWFECMFGLPGGIGLYRYADGRSWLHVDTCRQGSYWQASKPGSSNYQTVKSFVPVLRRTLIKTDKITVRLLQHLLYLCGYEIKLDGWFGSGTKAAVRDFQLKNGLKVDGIAGLETFTRLFQVSKHY